MGTPLVEGRMFADRATATRTWVAAVNETFAKRAFSGEYPAGEQIVDPAKQTSMIVGVLGDAR
jgi:hypothetical protein